MLSKKYYCLLLLLIIVSNLKLNGMNSHIAKKPRIEHTPENLTNICYRKIVDQLIDDGQTKSESQWFNVNIPIELEEILRKKINLALFKTYSKNINPSFFECAKNIALSKDNRFLILTYCDVLKVIDAKTGQCLKEIKHNHSRPIICITISLDNRFIVTGSMDNTAKIFDLETNTCLPLIGHADWVNSVSISPDNSFVITASNDGTVNKWETQWGKVIYPTH